jgi:hypothetical protein
MTDRFRANPTGEASPVTCSTPGADGALVQRLMGRSPVAPTVGYVRRPEAAIKKAAGLARVPLK